MGNSPGEICIYAEYLHSNGIRETWLFWCWDHLLEQLVFLAGWGDTRRVGQHEGGDDS